MVLSWSERDAGDLEAHFLESTSTDSSEESSPPASQDNFCSPPRPFYFPRGPPFKLFGSGHEEPVHHVDADSGIVEVDESSEEAKFRNGVTGKFVSDGNGAGRWIETLLGEILSQVCLLFEIYCGFFSRYITGHSTYVRGETADGGPVAGDEVSLHPLLDQVGGHTRLLVLNPATICKPLNRRELNFYENLPDDIREFVPSYKGIEKV